MQFTFDPTSLVNKLRTGFIMFYENSLPPKKKIKIIRIKKIEIVAYTRKSSVLFG